MRSARRRFTVALAVVASLGIASCATGPPRHTSRPAKPAPRDVDAGAAAPREPVAGVPGAPGAGGGSSGDGTGRADTGASDLALDLPVRIGLFWERGEYVIGSETGLVLDPRARAEVRAPGGKRFRLTVSRAGYVRIRDEAGQTLPAARLVRVRPGGTGQLLANGKPVRGELELSARADSLFVVNVVPLEEYLRGVVPLEIGPRPAAEKAAVAAQAVAARTYCVKRLGQYGSLPFDLYASVQDQAYEGRSRENAVADEAVAATRGLVLADEAGLIEAYYSSTCGGWRSDIGSVWPHRDPFPSLRGGPDGSDGVEWCRESKHFAWKETWSGWQLSRLLAEHAPALLELPPGTVRGHLLDLRETGRGPSGRLAGIEYVTTEGRWTVPGDRNRWILRRPDGGILRSVFVDLVVERRQGRVVHVTARGRGNGHGVGMCQVGAIARARSGADFRSILAAYYPGVGIRPMTGRDLPPGPAGAS